MSKERDVCPPQNVVKTMEKDYSKFKHEGPKYERSKYDNVEFWLTIGVFV